MLTFILFTTILSFILSASATAPTPSVNVQFFVGKSQNKDFCLTASQNVDGTPVTIAPCVPSPNNTDPNSIWALDHGSVAPGTISIFKDKCLTVPNGANVDGTKLHISTCVAGNANQIWDINTDDSVHWHGKNKCMDNNGGSVVSGNPVQIWTCFDGNVNQNWPTAAPGTPGVPAGGIVKIFKLEPGETADGCLTATSNSNGAAVVFSGCVPSSDSGAAAQSWTLTAGSSKFGKGSTGRINVFGDKCLDLTGGNTHNGARLQIWTCGQKNPNQMWNVNGDETIQWAGKGKCVDLSDGVKTDGTPVQSWACTKQNQNQEWFIFHFAGAGF